MTKSVAKKRFCPMCGREVQVRLVRKPDVDIKVCTNCGRAVSIRYKDD